MTLSGHECLQYYLGDPQIVGFIYYCIKHLKNRNESYLGKRVDAYKFWFENILFHLFKFSPQTQSRVLRNINFLVLSYKAVSNSPSMHACHVICLSCEPSWCSLYGVLPSTRLPIDRANLTHLCVLSRELNIKQITKNLAFKVALIGTAAAPHLIPWVSQA